MAKYSSSTTPAVIAGLAVASTLLLAFLLRKTWWSSSDRRDEQKDSGLPKLRAGGKKGIERFEEACAAVESAADGLPGASRLELYALYKQAIEGNCEEEEPSRLKAVARSKCSPPALLTAACRAAWRAKRGVTSDEAKAAYVQLASDLGLLEEMQENARDGRSGVGLLRRVAPCTAATHKQRQHLSMGKVASRGEFFTHGNLHASFVRLMQVKGGSDDDSLVNVTGEGRMTALHFAADRGFVDIVRLLIDRGADVNHTDDSGETPLHVAIAADQDEIVAMLIDAGADTSIKNNEGNSCAELLEQTKAAKG
ncbi:hypothetical protein Esti_000744 [Eimeria stiedai]